MKNALLLFSNFFILFYFLFLTNSQTFASATLNPVSGSNNEEQINAALKGGGTVHLNAGTYTISKTIVLQSNTVLQGDKGAKIFLAPHVKWSANTPMFQGGAVSNFRVTGFEIDGNRDNNLEPYSSKSSACGHYYYDMFAFNGASNIEIDNMNLHDNWNDIVIAKKTDGLKFHDNVVKAPGHDIVSGFNAKNIWVTNNNLRLFCNSAVRASSTNPMYIMNNDIARDTGAGGYAGIELQGTGEVWSCNNNIHDVKTVIADLSSGGTTLHTSGCPAAPTSSPSSPGSNTSGTGAGTPVPTIAENIVTPTLYCIGSCDTTPIPTNVLTITPTGGVIDSSTSALTATPTSTASSSATSSSATSSSTTASSTSSALTSLPATIWNFIIFIFLMILRFLGFGN